MHGASSSARSEIEDFLPFVLLQHVVETDVGQHHRESIDFSFLGLVRGILRGGSGGDVGVVFRAVRNGVCCCLESLYRGNHTKKERKNGQTFPFVCSTLVFQLCL